jgi:hypothetical protein
MSRIQYAGLELIYLVRLSKRWGPSPPTVPLVDEKILNVFLYPIANVFDLSIPQQVQPSLFSVGKIDYDPSHSLS